MLQKLYQPVVIDLVEVVSDIRIENPTDLLETYPDRERVERHMRPSPRPEAVREAEKVHLVDGVEHFGHDPLDKLVFQGRDTQGPLAAVRLGYVGSPRWLRSIRSFVQLRVKVSKIRLESPLVLLPRHSVDPGCRLLLNLEERVSKSIDGDVVEERAESLFPAPESSLSHAIQRI
jgi:hypothetical protein